MKKQGFLILGALIVLAVLFVSVSRNASDTGAVKVGVLLPLSGAEASFGEKMKQGIELAKAEFPGDNVVFVYEDTRGLAARETVSAYRKLRDIDKVDIIIGPFGPEATLAIAPLTDKDQVPVIAISLCESRFLEHPSVYCIFPPLDEGVLSAKPHLEKLGTKTVGLLTLNGELGDLIVSTFDGLEQERVLDLVAVEKVNPGEQDMRTVALKLMATNPDVIYIASTPEEGHLALRQLHELGYAGYRFAHIDSTEEILDGLGDAAEGVYFPGFISSEYPPAFVEAYKSNYQSEPDLYVALGHTPARFVLSFLESRDWDPSGVMTGLWKHADPKVSLKDFGFNEDRQVTIPQVTFFYDGADFFELDTP